ncbi:MAG: FAD-dependent monooxygenase [Clostridia bacterium]|nr:FAD-dependent monooxygenase [Clostridia bacterium]
MKRKGLNSRSLHFRLYKRSVDARRRNDIRFVCTVLVESETAISRETAMRVGLRELVAAEPGKEHGSEPMGAPPLVVGMGPAGLFAALLLAENGYRPILIDRGDAVADRVRAVERFRKDGFLDTESNIQFGAGGAGTFSDGKLVTRIHDSYCGYVLRQLHRFGAPEEILTLAKPHIGTDVLRNVVAAVLSEIERLGGKVVYRCRMDDFCEFPDGTIAVSTNRGEIRCGALLMALGHSARDTYRMLLGKQFAIEPKPMSVGVRAEHLQSDIDRALYGSFAGHPALGHAEYALSDTKGARGVYTFCMCPGGEVVAAASEEGGLVVNGMSDHARDGKNANAAVAVSLSCADYETVDGSRVLGAIALQRKIEEAAFRIGGSDYSAPVMTLGDFMNGTHGTEPSRVKPTYRGGKVRLADLSSVFSEEITASLRYAFTSFGKQIEGYDAPDAVLTAAETRTSAPLRILRKPDTMTALGHDRVYPCGEGAGYAGGITSAAVDGLRAAEALMIRFGGLS